MNIGKKIRKLRYESGIQAQDLADYLFISKPTLYNYEKGVASISAESILTLSQMFNVPISYFFDEDISYSDDINVDCSPAYIRLQNMIRNYSEEEREKAIRLLTIALE